MARDTSAGISQFDVATLIRRLEREYRGHIRIDGGLPVRQTENVALVWRVSLRREPRGAAGAVYERGASRAWPTGECTTLTGLFFRLLWDLEKVLSADAEEAERLTQGRLSGW